MSIRLAGVIAAGIFVSCAPHNDDLTCYIETPAITDVVIEGISRWEEATHGDFRCSEIVYGVRPQMAPNTIAFRETELAPPLLGLTYGSTTASDATVNLNPGVGSDLVVHEIGHAVGLVHVLDGPPSVMFPTAQTWAYYPTQRDLDAFYAR